MIANNRWSEISKALDIVFDVPPSERRDKVKQLCEGDSEFCQQLLGLLDAEENAPEYLDGVAGDLISITSDTNGKQDNISADHCGATIGPYVLTKEIGRGGMGVVYEAQRIDAEFQHRVAIKLLSFSSSSEMRRARFLQERQLLASLNHPNIAQLFDGGISELGQPYIVMELVKGQPIDEYCNTYALSIKERLELVSKVAEALSYIHQHFVIHRDIKPSNIIVGEDGTVKLLDFGIAKLSEDANLAAFSLQNNEDLTRTGEYFITPGYASPEQIRGQLTGAASDVYQLGLILYELLCGEKAFHGMADNFYQLAKVIVDKEPDAPSVVASKYSETQRKSTAHIKPVGLSGPHLQKVLRGDLDAIVLKALRTDPSARYHSMQELMEDISLYLGQRPVKARSLNFKYQLNKFLKRNWLEVTAVSAFILLLFIYAMTVTIQSKKIELTLAQSRIESEKAKKVSELFIDTFESADPYGLGAENISAKDLLEKSREKVFSELRDVPEIQGHLLLVLGDISYKLHENEESIALLEKALSINQLFHASASEIMANNYASLGYVYFKAGRYQEALEQLKAAISTYEKSEGLSRSALNKKFEAINDLGLVKKYLGHPDQAIQHWQELIAVIEEQYPDYKMPLANAINNLANVQHTQGEVEKAVKNAERAIFLMEGYFGELHPEVAKTHISLAVKLMDMEKHARAMRHFTKAANIYSGSLGDQHPLVVRKQVMIAILKHRQGDTEAAISDFNKILSAQLEIGDSKDIFSTLFRLASVYYDFGEFSLAEEKAKEALQNYKNSRVSTYLDGALSALLASVYFEQGRKNEAFELFDRALDTLPEKSMRTSMAKLEYARLLFHDNNTQEARSVAEEVLRYREARLPEKHSLLAKAKALHAASLYELGNKDSSIPVLVHCYQVLKAMKVRHAPYLDIARKILLEYFKVDNEADLINTFPLEVP